MSKQITMSMLAEDLGVTVTAVSRAFTPGARIKEEKRQLILARAAELGFQPNESASRLARQRLRLAAVISSKFPEYSRNLLEGIKAAEQKLAGYKVECDIFTVTSTLGEEATLLPILKHLEENEYDGILYSATLNGSCKPVLKQLAEKVPMALLGTDCPGIPYRFISQNNTEMAGHMAAELMADFVGGARRIMVFAGDLASEQQQALVGSFCRHANAYGLNVLPPVDTLRFAGNTAGAVNELLDRERLPDGIYVSTADCLPVCEALRAMPGPVLITSDIFEEMCPYFEMGIIRASIYQDPFAQAHDAFCQLYDLLARRRTTCETLLTKPQVILKSNLSLFPKVRKNEEV